MAARDDHPPARCKAPGVHMWEEQYDRMCDEIDRLRAELAEANACLQPIGDED